MQNYYNILEVDITTNNNNIKNSYKNKIKNFYDKTELSQDDINYIKLLKIGLYILTSQNLKNNYNKLLFNKEKDNKLSEDNNLLEDNKLSKDNNLLEDNILEENNEKIYNMDEIFNVNNKWMNNITINNDEKKLDNNMINNRIFTLHQNNNRYDENFLKPVSCRDQKKE
jgi:hypothetical protein